MVTHACNPSARVGQRQENRWLLAELQKGKSQVHKKICLKEKRQQVKITEEDICPAHMHVHMLVCTHTCACAVVYTSMYMPLCAHMHVHVLVCTLVCTHTCKD